MQFDKRIWKTAVLAVVITIVGSMFVMRLDEWSKGLNSEFIVYGQTGGGTGGSTGTSSTCPGGGSSCIIKVVPQIVLGGKYQTVIQIINTSGATANVSANFYTELGKPSTATYATNLNGTTGSFSNGILASTSLPINAILVITASDTGSIAINWGSIASSGSISVATVFEQRDGGSLLGRVGVPASPANMKQFVIPRMRNVGNFFDVGFALVNTGATDAVITVVLRDAAGQNPLTIQIPLAALSHTQGFVNELFKSAGLKDASAGTLFQSLTFTASSSSGGAQIAAVALAIEGANLASFPVDQIQ